MAGLEGHVIDHYRVVELVGQGGMASVYRAEDTLANRRVAIKVLSQSIAGDRQFVRRFRREAGILKGLKHPHIVSVLDYGESQGIVYLVMPYIVGETLYDRINRKRVTDAEAAKWIGQVAKALAHAHNQGFIHRDVKPSNILIDEEGNARLTDFGLARLIEDPNSLTGSMLMGTPAFISPEQAKGQRLGPPSDQYSLGVVCFLLATGRLPYEADSPMATVLMHVQDPVPMPRLFRPDLPEAVERVIFRAMAKDPEDRFASVLEMSRAYQTALAGETLVRKEGSRREVRKETPYLGSLPPGEAPRGQQRRRSAERLGIAVAGIATLVIAAAILAQRFEFRDLPGPGQASALVPSPSVTVPAVAPFPSTEAPPAAPTPTATSVVSLDCPVRMFGFQRQENEVSWSVENAGAIPVRVIEVEPRFTYDNPLQVLLGDASLVNTESVSTGETVVVGPFDKAEITPGGVTQLRIVYRWPIQGTGYAIRLLFDTPCVLETDW